LHAADCWQLAHHKAALTAHLQPKCRAAFVGLPFSVIAYSWPEQVTRFDRHGRPPPLRSRRSSAIANLRRLAPNAAARRE